MAQWFGNVSSRLIGEKNAFSKGRAGEKRIRAWRGKSTAPFSHPRHSHPRYKPFQLTFASMKIPYRRFHNFPRIEISKISLKIIIEFLIQERNFKNVHKIFLCSRILKFLIDKILRLYFHPPQKIFFFYPYNQNSIELAKNYKQNNSIDYIITRDLLILSMIMISIHPR